MVSAIALAGQTLSVQHLLKHNSRRNSRRSIRQHRCGLAGRRLRQFWFARLFHLGRFDGRSLRGWRRFSQRFRPSEPLRLFLGASMCIWAAMIVRGGVPEMFYMGLPVNIFPILLSVAMKKMRRVGSDLRVRQMIEAPPVLTSQPGV